MSEVSTEEAKGGVSLLADIVYMSFPLEVVGECDAKIGVVLDLLEYVVANGIKVGGFVPSTEEVAFFSR